MAHPALRDAAGDPQLRGVPICVYLWLCHKLDFHAPTPLPIRKSAKELAMKPHTLSRALRCLVDGGYLERRYVAGQVHHYRLLNARIPPLMPRSGTM